nr:hypothetical protein [Tanacetum cinerariifolium]
ISYLGFSDTIMSDSEDSTVTYTTSDPDEVPEEDDDEDPADYPADHDDEDEEEEHPASADSIPPPPTLYAGESSVAAVVRPIEGRRADYGFIDSVEAEIRQRRAEDIGYGIRDI